MNVFYYLTEKTHEKKLFYLYFNLPVVISINIISFLQEIVAYPEVNCIPYKRIQVRILIKTSEPVEGKKPVNFQLETKYISPKFDTQTYTFTEIAKNRLVFVFNK